MFIQTSSSKLRLLSRALVSDPLRRQDASIAHGWRRDYKCSPPRWADGPGRICPLSCDACRVGDYAHAASFDGSDKNRDPFASRKIAFKDRIEVAKWSADDPYVLAMLERPPGNLHHSVPAAGANVIDNSLGNGERLAARRYKADNSWHVANFEIVCGKLKPGKQVLRK
jgi:hypothetical protein